MGLPHVRDQGFAGLVLQLLESWSSDVDRQGFGPGFQMAGAFSLQAEHDLSHAWTLTLSAAMRSNSLTECKESLIPAGAALDIQPVAS
jgi:hypothetical protein